MSEYFTIKDVSERTGISAHTLRYYDKEGLLGFVHRSETGIRLFTEEDFEPLYTIACLKKSGMPIREIRRFMDLYIRGDETIHDRYLLFKEHRENLIRQIEELQETLDIVDYKCWYFEQAEKYGDINYYKKLPEEEVDERIQRFNQKVIDFRENKQTTR